MLELVRTINNNYAGVLSLISSLIMVVVTIIYVGHTKRQANYAKESLELIAKQMITEKQPCIVPCVGNSYGSAIEDTDPIRIQLGFDIKLKNYGDAPAINIYALAYMQLQNARDDFGNKKMLTAALLPFFVQALSAGEDKDIHIWFETSEVKDLVKELKKAMDMNDMRLRKNPYQNHYTGAKLIVQVLFKNMMGQWSESVISYEIASLEYRDSRLRKTNDLSRSIISPMDIMEGDKFMAVISTSRVAPFTTQMATEKYVNDILKQFTDDSPWLEDIIHD